MPLTNVLIRPGFNKQVTDVGAEGQWVDGDNVRFRYGSPEKIGGWDKTTANTLIGVVRDQHAWVALDGTRLAALGTDKKLYIYANDLLYDITPIRQTNTSVSSIFTTTNGSALR